MLPPPGCLFPLSHKSTLAHGDVVVSGDDDVVRKLHAEQIERAGEPRRGGRGPAHGLCLRRLPARARRAQGRRGRQGAAPRAAAPEVF